MANADTKPARVNLLAHYESPSALGVSPVFFRCRVAFGAGASSAAGSAAFLRERRGVVGFSAGGSAATSSAATSSALASAGAVSSGTTSSAATSSAAPSSVGGV
jgi:hypothetical protein